LSCAWENQQSNDEHSSWRSVFAAINCSSTLGDSHEKAVEKFLTTPEVLELLSKPFEAFSKPSPATKSTFETKTSAINITPSSKAPYDIKEIKDDVLWLSESARLDEVSALRAVVEEYQNRASTQLLGPFSEQELVGIREVTGNNRFSSPIPVSLLSHGLEPEVIEKDFGTQDNRRQRILRTYLSERQFFLKSAERLLHTYFKNDARGVCGKGKGAVDDLSWLGRCSSRLIEKMEPLNVESALLRCIKAIGANVQNLQTGSGCFNEDGGRPEIEMGWAQSQIIEATHSMEIIWQFLRYKVEFPSPQLVVEWFRLQQSCGFFDNFELVGLPH
jgi:nuclear pore complex protein Nup188